MEAAEALVEVEKAEASIRKVVEGDLADEMLKDDAESILNDIEMLASELRDVSDVADEVIGEE